MKSYSAPAPGGQEVTLSSLPASPAQKRLALCVVLTLLAGFVFAAGPLSTRPLARINGFVPAYGTAIFLNDLITAALLFGQFSIVRSRALLALASGYLLTAFVTVPWVLTFPGVLAPGALLGAGLQSTAWLYVLWHAGFALFAIVYALLKKSDPFKRISQGAIRTAILASVALVAALICGVTALVTAGDALMPRLVLDTVWLTRLWTFVAALMLALIFLAVALLWRRERSVLDLWLTVVLCAYAIEIALISFPVPARFTFGWYAGRVYGLFSSSLVLLILLKEITTLYSQLLRAVRAQHREREVRLMTGEAVSASIAHEVKQPLSAMTTSADAALRWLDRAAPDVDKAKAALERIVAEGHRAGAVVQNMRALYRKDKQKWSVVDVNDVIGEVLALVLGELEMHRVAVKAGLDERLPRISGDRVQLQQVLVNLITNAIDSMATTDGERVLSVRSEVDQSGSVMVSVEDTGTGVEPAVADRIFNPLFTTKAHGMGMGLPICRSIIEAHHGRLWVTANLPHGAIFHFTVPAHPGSAS